MDHTNPTDGRKFWQAALDSLAAHVAVLDSDGRIVAVNSAWRRFAAVNGQADPNGGVGINYLDVCRRSSGKAAPEAESAGCGIAAVLAGQRSSFSLSYTCHAPDRKRWFTLRATPFEGAGPARVMVTHEDITSTKAAQLQAAEYALGLEAANLELRRQAEALDCAEELETAAAGILELVAHNEPLASVLGETARLVERQFPGCTCVVALAREGGCEVIAARTLAPATLAEIETALAATLSEAAAPANPLVQFDRALRAAGACHVHPLHSTIIRGAGGELHGVLAVSGLAAKPMQERDPILTRAASLAAIAVDHKRMHDRLEFQALHDPITGLPNHLLFHDRVQQAVTGNRSGSKPFAVLAVDLDRFSRVRNVHGSRVKDALVVQVARRIANAAGARDTVGHSGGDEFLILLQEPESTADPARVARRIAAIFESPLSVMDREFQLACSIGISVFLDGGAPAAELVRNAGTALYQAKQGNAGACCVFEPGMGMAARERMEIEDCLRGAAAAGELEMHYQPQFDAARRPVAVEALMRWSSPLLGSVPPSRFIPVAEQSGLIVGLGNWALRRACMQSVLWRGAGLRSVRMAVNVSTLQLVRPDFCGIVAGIMAETGMDPRLLELEVTESAMMRDLQPAIEQIDQLRHLGVSVSVDDFGTGYSSLSYIQRLPVDVIKIDRSFVTGIDGRAPKRDSVVRAIVSLAHGLGMRVVAEGVETESQFRTLVAAGCDLYQGHLLARPMSPAQVEEVLFPVALPPATVWDCNRDILAREVTL